MLVLTALLHVIAFGAIAIELDQLGARISLFFLLIPVLILHLAIWSSARFLALHWAIVTAFVLNIVWAGAGYAFWLTRTALPHHDKVITFALTFVVTGFATSALLIWWVRFVVRRRMRAAEQG